MRFSFIRIINKLTKLINLCALPFNKSKSASFEILIFFPYTRGITVLCGKCEKLRERGRGGGEGATGY